MVITGESLCLTSGLSSTPRARVARTVDYRRRRFGSGLSAAESEQEMAVWYAP